MKVAVSCVCNVGDKKGTILSYFYYLSQHLWKLRTWNYSVLSVLIWCYFAYCTCNAFSSLPETLPFNLCLSDSYITCTILNTKSFTKGKDLLRISLSPSSSISSTASASRGYPA